MNTKPDDSKILISKYRTMSIDELKACINNLEESSDCYNKIKNINIAKKEFELKHKERQKQIELLTKSLSSSSRFYRWFKSIRAFLKEFVISRN